MKSKYANEKPKIAPIDVVRGPLADEVDPPAKWPDPPSADPIVVCGIPLNRFEARLFHDAARTGRLECPGWLPVASRLEEAWAAWNARNRPPIVRRPRGQR